MYHINFNSGIELGKSFNKAWLLDKRHLNKPISHVVSNPPPCRHYCVLSKLLLHCFQNFSSSFHQRQPHQITQILGHILYVTITNRKSSNGLASQQASALITHRTLHPSTAFMPAATEQTKTLRRSGSFQKPRSPRGLHVVFVLLWQQQQGLWNRLSAGSSVRSPGSGRRGDPPTSRTLAQRSVAKPEGIHCPPSPRQHLAATCTERSVSEL